MFSFEKKKNLNSEKHIPTEKILQDYRAITLLKVHFDKDV